MKRPIGLLVWPGEFPVSSAWVDLRVDARRFIVVRDERNVNFRNLMGASRDTLVFVPHGIQSRELYVRIRSWSFKRVINGLDECRDVLLREFPDEVRS